MPLKLHTTIATAKIIITNGNAYIFSFAMQDENKHTVISQKCHIDDNLHKHSTESRTSWAK